VVVPISEFNIPQASERFIMWPAGIKKATDQAEQALIGEDPVRQEPFGDIRAVRVFSSHGEKSAGSNSVGLGTIEPPVRPRRYPEVESLSKNARREIKENFPVSEGIICGRRRPDSLRVKVLLDCVMCAGYNLRHLIFGILVRVLPGLEVKFPDDSWLNINEATAQIPDQLCVVYIAPWTLSLI
jgi:hypothetical protein